MAFCANTNQFNKVSVMQTAEHLNFCQEFTATMLVISL
jgi:hypothetical protein